VIAVLLQCFVDAIAIMVARRLRHYCEAIAKRLLCDCDAIEMLSEAIAM
jgi:hypothetical protein